MLDVVLALTATDFYKSMTTHADHKVWQDVYYAQAYGLFIYIKVTYRPGGGPPVIAFKEKN